MKSKFYGRAVRNIWNDNTRYGIIRESKSENGWLYVKCKWIGDEKYEMDANRVSELRGIEKKENWTRIDKVKFIDIDQEINKLATLSYSVNQLNNSADFNYYLTESNNINYSEWT